MSDIKMSDVFVMPVSSSKGDLFNSKNPISDTRVCKFYNMNQFDAASAAAIAINSYDSNQELIAKQAEQIKLLQLDSDRWNAFINSPFRLFGYAGLGHDEPNGPCQKTGKNGYAHFGCEMWTKHSGWECGAGKQVLIGFADQAIAVNKLANQTGGE